MMYLPYRPVRDFHTGFRSAAKKVPEEQDNNRQFKVEMWPQGA
jgi:hypothetical protein